MQSLHLPLAALLLCAAALASAVAADSPAKLYSDPHGFTLRYPANATLAANEPENGQLDLTSTAAVVVSPNLDAYKGSNLREASLTVGVSNDAATVAACADGKAAQGEKPTGNATLAGIKFTRFAFEDAGAGDRYASTIYRGVSAGDCYELAEFVHWETIENFSPGTVKEFERPKIEAELHAITRSFALKSKTP
jgi:hypothetical protein